MKHITAFVGSARKKFTYNSTRQFLDNLVAMGDVDYDIVTLSDSDLKPCLGCKLCFEKGEQACPLNDDVDALIELMHASDGVVIASPNYAFQVSARVKILLERMGYVLHRPAMFGKTYSSIVAQGIYGGDKIRKYLDFTMNSMGFDVVKGSCITALEPMTAKEQAKVDKKLAMQAQRYHTSLTKDELPKASWMGLMAFRMGRTSMMRELDESSRDFTYYRDKGWFEADYFYPTKLGLSKKLVGAFFDAMAKGMSGENR